ncbi:hypothetical protein B296_00056922 [Ensete ventricosum]|uniref:Uncharacterized protein n=1 Tax=Ensete ventricosum TaxID=4639 RepID=A0A426XTA7_ENSVE|nr:hypothetical protein B296_00056922 [Ensete ventricosum]
MEARPRCDLRPLILSAWLGRSTGARPRCNPRPSMLNHVEAGGWTHLGVGLDRVERLEEALRALSWMRQRCKVVEAWFPGLSLAHLGSDSTALKQGVHIHLEWEVRRALAYSRGIQGPWLEFSFFKPTSSPTPKSPMGMGVPQGPPPVSLIGHRWGVLTLLLLLLFLWGLLPGLALELYEEVASGQFASLLQAPFAPSLGVAAPHIESSIEEGPNLPLSLIGQGPCVDSSDPSLGPCAMTPPREEAANEPFAPTGRAISKICWSFLLLLHMIMLQLVGAPLSLVHLLLLPLGT